MSSPSYHPPPHLHRVNLHSHGKRPFEECGGYDSDPDTSMPIQPASGTSSSNTRRYPTATSPSGPHNPEARNKRARSTSSTSTDDSSNPSSSGYTTAQSSSHSDLSFDGPSALPVNAAECPVRPVASPAPFVSTQQVHMSDLHLPIPPAQPQRPHVPTPPVPEDTLRTSLQRFAEFDRQIAALRTSLAATRSPPLPPFGPSVPSVDGDPAPVNDHWRSNSSNFLSNGTSGPSSTAIDLASSTLPLAPSETFNSLSTFASSNDSANLTVSTSTTSGSVPSTSFSPTYSNVPRYPPYPSYRPSVGGASSLVAHERVGEAISSSSTPATMRPSPNEYATRVDTRSSILVEAPSSSSSSHIRRVRRTLSPLVFPPDPSSYSSSVVTDDIPPGQHTQNGTGELTNGRSQRNRVDNPVTNQDRPALSSLPEDHLGEQPPTRSPHSRLGDRIRVIREPSIQRESVPTVFDVFSISESSHDQNRPSSSREPARYPSITEPVPPRALGTPNERSRDPTPISTAANTSQAAPQDTYARINSSWTSIPSSNSLMSESASERRHALALERFRVRSRRSSFDADDESDNRWLRDSPTERERGRENDHDLGVASPVPLSPSVENVSRAATSTRLPLFTSGASRLPQSTHWTEPSPSTPLNRSFSELFSDTQRMTRDERAEAWLHDWDAPRMTEQERQVRERERERQQDRQQERTWEWDLQRERTSHDVPGRSFASGFTRASTSSAREESVQPPLPTMTGPSRPSVGQLATAPNTIAPTVAAAATTTNNSHPYSYSNLNLSSFQSGLFRDSLRRNVEVDQASFSSGPAIPSVNTGESRTASRLGFDDSGSDMDLDDFMRTRPPSPEWSRPQPYAGRTPPPDYSPPPRNFILRPGFSVLRRGSLTNYDSRARPQHTHRNTFSGPVRPGASGPTRPSSYENNNRSVPLERTERDRFLPTRILESFYRTHEDGRRNTTTGAAQPFHPQPAPQNHALASSPSAVSRNERGDIVGGPRSASGNGTRPSTEAVNENRRGTLGLGGSLRSRFARFASSQASSNAGDASSPRQRLASHPIGARPQVEPHRRPSGFGNAHVREQDRSDGRGMSGALPWSAHESSAMVRDVPWIALGPRGAFGSSPPSASGSTRSEVGETNRAEEQRPRLRTLRQRLQLDRGSEGMRVFRPGVLRAAIGRRGNLGDYVPDELFDDSYEALISLSNMLGEARSRATPDEVITTLPTGTFKEWKRDDSEARCPICLEDYEPSDVVMKLIECPHWLHKNCLEQWLKTANTCPVCREKVKASPKPAPARRRPYRDSSSPSEANHGNNYTSGIGFRTSQPNSQSNNGRPVSFAAIMFDRMMNEGRDATEPWPSPTSQATPGARDIRSIFLERMRIEQQQMQQRAREPSHGQELPFHMRVPPPSQSARPSANTGMGATDGLEARPVGFVSLTRGQGSDTSISSSTSSNILVDELDMRDGRRSMGATGPGPLFLDAPTTQRRETLFQFVPPPPSFDAHGHGHGHGHAPTVMISSSTESSREWRGGNVRMYDALFNVETSRSSSSGSSSSSASAPQPITNRLPIHEDSSDDNMFVWNLGR